MIKITKPSQCNGLKLQSATKDFIDAILTKKISTTHFWIAFATDAGKLEQLVCSIEKMNKYKIAYEKFKIKEDKKEIKNRQIKLRNS